MGRTLHFSIFGNDFGEQPLRLADHLDLNVALGMLQNRFTWTCESLSLETFEHLQITYSDHLVRSLGLPRVGTSMTKVGSDEWNALLVTRFAQWVSARLPHHTVRLHDEGSYILARYLEIHAGTLHVDAANIDRWRVYLRSNGFTDVLATLDQAELLAKQGVFFADVPAVDYADRSEIKALGIPMEELATMSLADVAARFTFPWDTEWVRSK